MKQLSLILSICFLVITSCSNSPGGIENGVWRGVLKTDSGIEIPFNFSVADEGERKVLHIINGSEKLRVDDVVITDDSIKISLPLFDSQIKAVLTTFGMAGKWVKHLGDKDVSMSFTAEPNVSWRFFKANVESNTNINGRWSTVFVSQDGKDTTVAIGEFKQNKAKLTGTFLTTTGDYRYLEGTISDSKLYLSAFDGSHAFLFTGNVVGDSVISNGKFYSGASSVENWTARKDAKAILPDAYSLTTLKPGKERISFSFPDLDRRRVSLADSSYKNKVLVIQFLGTWCPNCMDETSYLSSLYGRYHDKGVEVIGLAYERTTDIQKARFLVQKLKDRFSIRYPLLITGYTNREVLKSIPEIKNFNAFPTTIIIDKNGKVRKIHTGFSGPGTGTYYQEFISEFEKQINDLLAE